MNLDDYSKKIFENGVTFEAWAEDKLVGLLAAYFNNEKKRLGFITNLSVDGDYVGRGIASQLVADCIEYGNKDGFVAIQLEVEKKNVRMVNFYKKFGFYPVTSGSSLFMEIKCGEDLKIGIIVPAGDLRRFGYHRHVVTALKSFCRFADKVILVSSNRHVVENLRVTDEFGNLEIISSPATWLKEDATGKEISNFDILNNNINLARKNFQEQGFDVAIMLHTNQYIPEGSVDGLMDACETMVRQNLPFAYFYKKYQLRDIIFNADRRLPWILNLKNGDYEFAADSIRSKSADKMIGIETGNYRKFNNEAVVDIMCDYTYCELKDKTTFINEEIHKLKGVSPAEIKMGLVIRYEINKILEKEKSMEPLSQTGVSIRDVKGDKRELLSEIYRKLIDSRLYNFKKYFKSTHIFLLVLTWWLFLRLIYYDKKTNNVT